MKKIFLTLFLILSVATLQCRAFEEADDADLAEFMEDDFIEYSSSQNENNSEDETPFSLYAEKYEPLHGKAINSKLPDLKEVSATSGPINLPLGDMIIGVSAFSTDPHGLEYDNLRLSGKYRFRRFRVNAQLAQIRTDKVNNQLSNTIWLSPELDLTKSLSLKSDFSSDLKTKENKGGLALNYHPSKSFRDLEFELGFINTYKQNVEVPQQRFRLLTKFKI